MTSLIVGDPAIFAVESSISQPFASLGQRALGFFIIHAGGKSFGVRSSDATLLACSVDAIQQRLRRRGCHVFPFGNGLDALAIAEAVIGSTYDENWQPERFGGISSEEFRGALISNGIIWAPDGDAAFDDGSHVLQFDNGNDVRIIAFIHSINKSEFVDSIVDISISSEDFYEIIDQWQSNFESEWAQAKVGH